MALNLLVDCLFYFEIARVCRRQFLLVSRLHEHFKLFYYIFCLRDKTCVGDYQNIHLDKMPYMFSSLEWCCCGVSVADIVV